MIARIWRGAVRKDDADAYAEYMQATEFAGYAGTPGNRGVYMLRRGPVADRSLVRPLLRGTDAKPPVRGRVRSISACRTGVAASPAPLEAKRTGRTRAEVTPVGPSGARAALRVDYLERIADHGVDIGGLTVFLVTGERIESAMQQYLDRDLGPE